MTVLSFPIASAREALAPDVAVFLELLLKCLGKFYGTDVLPLDVRHKIFAFRLANQHLDLRQSCGESGPVASMPGNDLVSSIASGRDRDRLDEAYRLYGRCQSLHVPEDHPLVARVLDHLVDALDE